MTDRLPDELVACVGGGSNSIGLFHPFLDHPSIKMTGVEAGGISLEPGEHVSRFSGGRPGVFKAVRVTCSKILMAIFMPRIVFLLALTIPVRALNMHTFMIRVACNTLMPLTRRRCMPL